MLFTEDTLGEFFEKQVEKSPDRDFIVYPDRGLRFTYKEFDERVNLLAKGLLSLGIGKGDHVGIWALNVPDWLTFMSTRLFADSTLDILSSGDAISKLEPNIQETLINLQIEFLSCKCKDRPFCDCFQMELSRRILKQRMMKRDPAAISKKLMVESVRNVSKRLIGSYSIVILVNDDLIVVRDPIGIKPLSMIRETPAVLSSPSGEF